MRKFMSFILSLITALTPVASLAQQPEPAQNATPAIRVQARVVLVDLVATDNSGKPVTDLKPEDFTVEESGHKQKVAFFSLEQAGQAAPAQELPAGVYSNRPEYNAPGGPMTVVLIDSLNTPVRNQMWLRDQLVRYAAYQLNKNERVAVYGLSDHLTKLQDFTTDPEALRLAIEKFKPQNTPNTPQEHSGSAQVSSSIATITGPNGRVEASMLTAINLAVQGIREFEAGENSFNLQ